MITPPSLRGRGLPARADANVADVLSSGLDQIDASIVSAADRLLARARARGVAGWDVADLVKDWITGTGQTSLRQRIFAEAEKIRATIAAGRG